jgi:multicomponent Na+:H+ antiporter subunit G
MNALEILTAVLILVGAAFFLAGTVGLLRFPDLHSRIHALTKADNLGLGFIALGLLLQADSVFTALKILLVWLLALSAAATSGYLIASHGVESSPAERSDDV